MILNFLFLTPLFIIGIVCSWTDIREGKIRNKWVGLGFVWVLILYLSLIIYNYFFLHQSGNIGYVKDMLVNGFVALVLGYVLWNFKFLAAGDAKLFALYAFLIPPEFYAKSYYIYFPSFVLLINIFIPLILFLTIKALGFTIGELSGRIKKISFENIFKKENLGKIKKTILRVLRMYILFSLAFIVLQTLIREVTGFFGGLPQGGISTYLFVFLFFVYRFFFRFISKSKILSFLIIFLGIGCAIYLILSAQIPFLLNAIKLALIFMTAIGVIYRLLDYYIERKEVRKVDVKEVKEGMFLSARDLDEEIKKKIGDVAKRELSREQVELVRDFLKDKPGKELKIYKTFALAPFIFLGALITLVTQGSLTTIILRALQVSL